MPSLAPGAITAKVGDNFPIIGVTRRQHVDIVFEATGASETVDEALAFYDLGLRLVRNSGPENIARFVAPYATKLENGDGFVFPDSAEFVVAEATPDFILVNVSANPAANFDITSGKKVARVYYEIDDGVTWDTSYEIRLDPELTIFAAGAGDDPIIPVRLVPGTIFGRLPEPSGMSVPALAAFALRRRRASGPAARG